MPTHRLVETRDILPQKAPWTEHDKSTIRQLPSELRRFAPANSCDLVNRRVCRGMKSDDPRPLLLAEA